jgi:hypothetical protein
MCTAWFQKTKISGLKNTSSGLQNEYVYGREQYS